MLNLLYNHSVQHRFFANYSFLFLVRPMNNCLDREDTVLINFELYLNLYRAFLTLRQILYIESS